MSIGFFFMDSLPSNPPGQVVPLLPGIQIVRGHDPDLLAALDHDSGQHPAGIGFAVDLPAYPLWVALFNRLLPLLSKTT